MTSTNNEETSFKLVKIESTLERILNHHVEFKQLLAHFGSKIDEIKGDIHQQELKIKDIDSGIRQDVNRTWLKIAGAIILVMSGFFGSVIYYIAEKIPGQK